MYHKNIEIANYQSPTNTNTTYANKKITTIDTAKNTDAIGCVASIDDITSIAAHNGGSRNIKAVLDNRERLATELKFTPAEIRSIAANEGGSRNIEAVLNSYETLLTDFEFNPAEITSIAAHGGGSLNIKAVLESCQSLTKFEFSITAEFVF